MHGDETSPETQAPKCFAKSRNRRCENEAIARLVICRKICPIRRPIQFQQLRFTQDGHSCPSTASSTGNTVGQERPTCKQSPLHDVDTANLSKIGVSIADLDHSFRWTPPHFGKSAEPDFQECVDCPAGRGSEFPGMSSSIGAPLESYRIRMISFRCTYELSFGSRWIPHLSSQFRGLVSSF